MEAELYFVKQVLAVILTLSLLCQCTVQLLVVGYYELNKSYIAKNLCENRSRPEKKCCGKCYLHKQLKKVDDASPNGKNLPNKIDKNEVVVYVLPQPISFPQVIFAASPIHRATQQHMYHSDVADACFHPPAVTA